MTSDSTMNTEGEGIPAATSKLRSSCDPCGAAKVKCDRKLPSCGRCLNLRKTCKYGQSRLKGRPPKRKLQTRASRDAAGASPDEVAVNGGLGNTARHAGSLNTDEPRGSTERNEPVVCLTVTSVDASDALTTARGKSCEPFGDPGAFSLYNYDGWSHLEVFGNELLGTVEADDSVDGTPLECVQDSAPSHSCAREPYEILADLVCPAPDLHVPTRNSETVAARLDRVLEFNRKAIERMSLLLECSCSNSGHRVMVHAAIISRILIWYQQAAGWGSGNLAIVDANGERSPSSELDQPTGRRESEIAHIGPTGFTVSDAPVALGTFPVEDQQLQSAIRKYLVLNELSNMAPLIELFKKSKLSSNSPTDGLSRLYSSTASWLEGEYLDTLNRLKAGRLALSSGI